MFIQAFKELDGFIHMHVCATVHHRHKQKDKNVCIQQMAGG